MRGSRCWRPGSRAWQQGDLRRRDLSAFGRAEQGPRTCQQHREECCHLQARHRWERRRERLCVHKRSGQGKMNLARQRRTSSRDLDGDRDRDVGRAGAVVATRNG